MKNGVFWDVTPWLLVAASIVPSSLILVTLMKEAQNCTLVSHCNNSNHAVFWFSHS
jgi:hypothetical protein